MNEPLKRVSLDYTATNPDDSFLSDYNRGRAFCLGCNTHFEVLAHSCEYVELNRGFKCVFCGRSLEIEWYKQFFKENPRYKGVSNE